MFYKYGEITAEKIKELVKKNTVVVLPLGAIEQHGPHLPLDTDDYYAYRWAIEACKKAAQDQKDYNFLLMPPVHYGHSLFHFGLPGTISLSAQTFIRVTVELVEGLMDSGFKKVVLVNGNGGNKAPLQSAVTELKVKAARNQKKLLIYLADDTNKEILSDETWKKLAEINPEADKYGFLHGGALETSKLLDGRPEAVRKDKFNQVELSEVKKGYPGHYLIKEVSKTGAMGKPSLATVETGRIIWDALINNLAEKLIAINNFQED